MCDTKCFAYTETIRAIERRRCGYAQISYRESRAGEVESELTERQRVQQYVIGSVQFDVNGAILTSPAWTLARDVAVAVTQTTWHHLC